FSHVYLPEMQRNNVQIATIGDFASLPTHTKQAIQHAKDETKHNDGLRLKVAINNGGRYVIIRAFKEIASACEAYELDIAVVTEALWPDFNEALFEEALKEYEKRKRRYGGV